MPDAATEGPVLDVLLPPQLAGRHLAAVADEAELRALYAYQEPPEVAGPTGPAQARVQVRANMVTTLDGAATGADHVSGSINGSADSRVFRVLRTLADVVLIGAGTARAEGYADLSLPAALAGARVDDGRPPRPALAVVCGAGPVPDALFGSEHPPYLMVGAERPDIADLRSQAGDGHVLVAGAGTAVDLGQALQSLAALGLTRVLAEGGPRLMARLVTQGLVDEFCLTLSPLLVAGPAPRILDGADWLSPALRAHPAHLLHAEGVLLGRWILGDRPVTGAWSTAVRPG